MKWRTLALLFIANTIGGCTPAMFEWLATPGASFASMLAQSRYGLVYAWCIGTLCFATIEPIARRVRCRLPRLFQVPSLLLALVALAVIGSLPASLLLVAFGLVDPHHFWGVYRHGLFLAIAFTILIGSIVTAFEIVRHRLDAATIELRNRQLAEERARKAATEARLNSLESRVHPHFLFNTLNSISALIREDPRAAERTVERLAALLRDSLEMNHNRMVPLARELRMVEDYLEIERTRYGGRLRYSIDVPASLGQLEVPPFCLQTLVENSVKHVVSTRREGAEIAVAARVEDGRALLEVTDDGPGFEAAGLVPGHGLDSLKDRLSTLFDGDAYLRLGGRAGRATVSLSIPLGKVPA